MVAESNCRVGLDRAKSRSSTLLFELAVGAGFLEDAPHRSDELIDLIVIAV